MRVLAPAHRVRTRHRGAPATVAPLTIERPATPAPLGLGLAPEDLEELLLAIGDREDLAGPDARARLLRGRRALERELLKA